MNTITPLDLYDRMKNNDDVVIIDVRNPDEYNQLHITGAILQPLPDLDPKAVIDSLSQQGLMDKDIFVTCAGGMRAHRACALFIDADIPNVTVIEGGTKGWYNEGLPVEGTSVL